MPLDNPGDGDNIPRHHHADEDINSLVLPPDVFLPDQFALHHRSLGEHHLR